MKQHIFTLEFELELICCTTCGIPFAMPKDVAEYRREDAEDDDERAVYCPSGHRGLFQKSDPVEAVKRETKRERQLKQQITKLLHDREQAEAKSHA